MSDGGDGVHEELTNYSHDHKDACFQNTENIQLRKHVALAPFWTVI